MDAGIRGDDHHPDAPYSGDTKYRSYAYVASNRATLSLHDALPICGNTTLLDHWVQRVEEKKEGKEEAVEDRKDVNRDEDRVMEEDEEEEWDTVKTRGEVRHEKKKKKQQNKSLERERIRVNQHQQPSRSPTSLAIPNRPPPLRSNSNRPPAPRNTPHTIVPTSNESHVSNREDDLHDQLRESRQQIHFLQSQITSMNEQMKEQRDLIASLQVMPRRVDANTRPGRDSTPLSLGTIPVANAATSPFHV